MCTGNICRSPAAQLLLADRLGGDVDVVSAGSRALVGQPVEPAMARLLQSVGPAMHAFAAQRLTAALVREADLVIGLAREHRSAAVQLAPSALKRSFTLRELSRLAEQVDPAELREVAGPGATLRDRLRALTVVAPRHRTPVAAEADDVVDPYRCGDDVFVSVHTQIVQCVDTLVAVLVRAA